MPPLDFLALVRESLAVGESNFREFKSAWQGPPGHKQPRPAALIRRDIGEALVAFANADGGELLVGVEDDGRVTGIPHGEPELETFTQAPRTNVLQQTPLASPQAVRVTVDGQLVLFFSVDKSTRYVHLTSDGRCLQRRDRETVPVASEGVTFARQEQTSREYDRVFVDGARIADLDAHALEAAGRVVAPGLSAEQLLQWLGLAEYFGGSVRLRRAALLLFAHDVRRWHPRCEVRIVRVAGTELLTGANYNVRRRADDQVIVDSITKLMTRAWDALRPHLVETKYRAGIFEQVMYPEEACREALINAIAHRDYQIEGRGTEVFVFDDRMEVRSPGGLLSTVTVNDLKRLAGVHQSRNAFVARTLKEVGFMREIGEGIRRIFELMREHDLVVPELVSSAEDFTVVLRQKSVVSGDDQRWLDAYDGLVLERDERSIVLMARSTDAFSPNDMWTAVGLVDTEDYRKLVERLQLKGLLMETRSKHSAQNQARRTAASVRDVGRFTVRSPEDWSSHFHDLKRVVEEVSDGRPLGPPMVSGIRDGLPDASPFKRSADNVRRILQMLNLAGNRDLVARKGRPVTELSGTGPGLATTDDLGGPSRPVAIVIKRLPIDYTAAEVRELLGNVDDVVRVKLPRRREGFTYRRAVVEFTSGDAAERAIASLSDAIVDGQPLSAEVRLGG